MVGFTENDRVRESPEVIKIEYQHNGQSALTVHLKTSIKTEISVKN